jgi:SH3 domain protein
MPDTLRFCFADCGIKMTNLRLMSASLLLFATAAEAQRMYVTDELVITLRTGPSTQNTVIANLQTGDGVEVLETDQETGYSRIRVVDGGDEGWVLTRYLMPDPSSDEQLAAAEAELALARERIADLEAEQSKLSTDLSAATAALGAAQESRRSVSAELEDIRAASSNVIELQQDNDSLRRTNLELSAEVDALLMETSRLGGRSRQNWFVVGALVLAFGILIGLVAPSLRPRKRSNW